MRLIIEYTMLADCGGDSFTVSEPAVYGSKDSFLKDFEKILRNKVLDRPIIKMKASPKDNDFSDEEVVQFKFDDPVIELGGNVFYSYHFVDFRTKEILLPQVFTLEEWFAKVEGNQENVSRMV